MKSLHPLILFDNDLHRRALFSRHLLALGHHVEPFEDISEIARHWPRSGLILAHDDGESLSALMQHMSNTGNWLPVVAFAKSPRPRQIVEAILDGAIDYMGWPPDDSELAATLENAQARVDKLSHAKLREAIARSRVSLLTRREREVLNGVADGLSNRKIGERLDISPRTVEIHRANMLTKMGANHTSEAIRIAIEASLMN